MPRTTPPDRLSKLLDAAASAFVEHGFQRTQMDDIADRLGVSKGTIYRAVESKEALFAAVIHAADHPPADTSTVEIDAVGGLTEIAGSLRAELTSAVAALELTSLVTTRAKLRTGASFAEEVERVAVGVFGVLQRRRVAVMVLDRCAGEIPELTTLWFGEGRYALVDLWAAYLDLRARHITAGVDRDVLARTIVEVLTIWAVKMPWDPAPRPYVADPAQACAAMIRNLVIGPTR